MSRIHPLSGIVFDIETRRAVGLSDKLGIQEKVMGLDAMEVDELISLAHDEGIKLGKRNKRESIYSHLVDHYGKVIEKAALKPYGAEVYAIAFGGLGGGSIKTMAVTEEAPETVVITRFLAALEKIAPVLLVGFNVRNFDIPILRTRCALLGLSWPDWMPQNRRQDKYNDDVVWDIQDVLDEGNLDTWLRVCDLPPKTAQGGSVQDMSPREVAQYCADDVERERMLARRIIINTKHRGMIE
jgi:hypothetical protein